MSNYCQLVLLSVKALSTFDLTTTGVDTHLEGFLLSSECNFLNDSDQIFVSEVFAGCVRYQELLKVVVSGYYATEGKTCLRADSTLYSVLTYLIMFRLEELGMGHFKKLILTQHVERMHQFLRFFFDEKNLKGWIKDEWCRIYDSTFVEATVMSPMLRLEPAMREFIQQLSDRASNRTHQKKAAKPTTEVKPFNLTKHKPHSVPTPERIPTLKAYRPAPKSTYFQSADREKLAQAFERNQRRAEVVLEEANKMQFSCATHEKSEKTKAVMQQIIAERQTELQCSPPKPVPVPLSMKESRPVKLNAVAILREGARVQREEEEEERRLASLEAGQRDASEFTRWQEEMKQKEAAERLAEIERKHLEGQLSYEEAIIARQTCINENKERVAQLKEESNELMQQFFAQREEEKRKLRKLVEQTWAGHQNTKEAKMKLQLMKQEIVQQVAKEKQELMARALEEAEAEMHRKADLIQQIRAMESVPIVRTKFVDLTKTSGQGLLTEMSVVELRERLSLMKVAEAEEEERRRKEIASGKQAKEQLLQETLESISRHRAEQTRQAVLKDEKQKKTFTKQYEDLKDKKLSDLQQRLEVKRKEREKLKQSALHSASNGGRPVAESAADQRKRVGKNQSSSPSIKSISLSEPQQQSLALSLLLRTSQKDATT